MSQVEKEIEADMVQKVWCSHKVKLNTNKFKLEEGNGNRLLF